MSEMSCAEICERYTEGLKKTVSRCKEMSRMQKSNTWLIIAQQLELLRKKGETVMVTKALSRSAQLIGVEKYQKTRQ